VQYYLIFGPTSVTTVITGILTLNLLVPTTVGARINL